jgi:hypothetical protein
MKIKKETKMKIRQQITTEKGTTYNICPICNEKITYPEGVYFRNGVEVHCKCVTIARLRRGQIAGIDYQI